MRTNLLTVSADATLLEVQHLLVVAQISGAPVIDATGVVVGVLSATDVLGAMEQVFDEDEDEDEPDILQDRLEAITARDIASPEVVWVGPDASISQVAEVMRREGIHRVLVGTREHLEGILTTYDLLGAV
jgi:CBS domain-containing protein